MITPHRTLYLVAYDICEPHRLARVHRYLCGWAVGGQKSFYECWLTTAELKGVRSDLDALTVAGEDRIHIFQLDARMLPRCFGVATTSQQQFTIIV
jgi:CRISPR-associated protein Cas2